MLLLVNADNVTGEGLPHLIDGLMARGAASVHAVPVMTKKGRSGFLFFVDAPEAALEGLGTFLALELDTLGMRVFEPRHVAFGPLRRGVVSVEREGVPVGLISAKIIAGEGELPLSCKAEYGDMERFLKGPGSGGLLSFKTLKAAVELALTGGEILSVGPWRFCPRKEEASDGQSHRSVGKP